MADKIEDPATASKFEIPPAVQLFYADVAIGINIGLSTSRVLLGNEISPGQAAPALTIIMPTASIIQLAQSILAAFSTPEVVKKLEEANKGYTALRDSLVVPKK